MDVPRVRPKAWAPAFDSVGSCFAMTVLTVLTFSTQSFEQDSRLPDAPLRLPVDARAAKAGSHPRLSSAESLK